MEKMNISPENIDTVVISHIHGDHVGGLTGFLERNGNVKIYIPACFPRAFRDIGAQKVALSHCSEGRCRGLFEEEYKEDYIESGAGKITKV